MVRRLSLEEKAEWLRQREVVLERIEEMREQEYRLHGWELSSQQAADEISGAHLVTRSKFVPWFYFVGFMGILVSATQYYDVPVLAMVKAAW